MPRHRPIRGCKDGIEVAQRLLAMDTRGPARGTWLRMMAAWIATGGEVRGGLDIDLWRELHAKYPEAVGPAPHGNLKAERERRRRGRT